MVDAKRTCARCVFRLAFRCCVHPKAGQNTFVCVFNLFLISDIFHWIFTPNHPPTPPKEKMLLSKWINTAVLITPKNNIWVITLHMGPYIRYSDKSYLKQVLSKSYIWEHIFQHVFLLLSSYNKIYQFMPFTIMSH